MIFTACKLKVRTKKLLFQAFPRYYCSFSNEFSFSAHRCCICPPALQMWINLNQYCWERTLKGDINYQLYIPHYTFDTNVFCFVLKVPNITLDRMVHVLCLLRESSTSINTPDNIFLFITSNSLIILISQCFLSKS